MCEKLNKLLKNLTSIQIDRLMETIDKTGFSVPYAMTINYGYIMTGQ